MVHARKKSIKNASEKNVLANKKSPKSERDGWRIQSNIQRFTSNRKILIRCV